MITFINRVIVGLLCCVVLSLIIVASSLVITHFIINPFILLFFVGLISGAMVPVTIYFATKFGFTNSLIFELHGKTYYIRPWKLFIKNARHNFPRKVYSAGEMPNELIEEIKNTKMDDKHNHLNKYYDDTH